MGLDLFLSPLSCLYKEAFCLYNVNDHSKTPLFKRTFMGKMIDISGQRFGFWVALKCVGKNKSGQTQWLCQCECGSQKIVTSNSLRTGNSTSCGCNHKPDLTGQKFGKLTVIGLETNKSKGRRFWICKCDCGTQIVASTYQLREKVVISCSCHYDSLKINQYQGSLPEESMDREDFPDPSSFYSPKYQALLQTNKKCLEKLQQHVQIFRKTSKRNNDLIKSLLRRSN